MTGNTMRIERIHNANLVNFGIVPFLFVEPSDYNKIEQGDELTINGLRATLEREGRAVLRNVTQGVDIVVQASLSARQKRILLAGGLLNQTRPDHVPN